MSILYEWPEGCMKQHDTKIIVHPAVAQAREIMHIPPLFHFNFARRLTAVIQNGISNDFIFIRLLLLEVGTKVDLVLSESMERRVGESQRYVEQFEISTIHNAAASRALVFSMINGTCTTWMCMQKSSVYLWIK